MVDLGAVSIGAEYRELLAADLLVTPDCVDSRSGVVEAERDKGVRAQERREAFEQALKSVLTYCCHGTSIP